MTKGIRKQLSELADSIQVQVSQLEIIEAQRQQFFKEVTEAMSKVCPTPEEGYQSYDHLLFDLKDLIGEYVRLRNHRSSSTLVINEPASQ